MSQNYKSTLRWNPHDASHRKKCEYKARFILFYSIFKHTCTQHSKHLHNLYHFVLNVFCCDDIYVIASWTRVARPNCWLVSLKSIVQHFNHYDAVFLVWVVITMTAQIMKSIQWTDCWYKCKIVTGIIANLFLLIVKCHKQAKRCHECQSGDMNLIKQEEVKFMIV